MKHIVFLSVLSFYFHIRGYECMDIIGGNEVVPHSRPYMAYITTPVKDKKSLSSCGGALIKANWVLTAAHCVFGTKTKVTLGAHSLTKDTQQQQQIYGIKRFIQHPCFDHKTKVNDIQLVQLEKPAKLNKIVALLSLPKNEENIKPGTMCSTAGWGLTKQKTMSDVLRQANLTVVDSVKCSKIYSKQKGKPQITSSMICAGPLKRHNDDTCQGDSGGPLICNNRYTGIVSFGPFNKCGDPKIPGVYTRLTNSYLKWIIDTTGGDSH
ncbi:granzyme A-like [Pseudophryne corroboree]|uniref:granzyme A-like n=1 Tax=Pseudophryne corroboree TaxID=495146 RepID=UPI003081D5C5